MTNTQQPKDDAQPSRECLQQSAATGAYPPINPKDFDSDSDFIAYLDAWRHAAPGKDAGEKIEWLNKHIHRLMHAYVDADRARQRLKPLTLAQLKQIVRRVALEIGRSPLADDIELAHAIAAALQAAPPAPAAVAAPDWWRKRADEIELQVALSGSKEAMRCYTDMRTLLQSVAEPRCLTCNDHGAVGNILTAEPCPDCTPAPAAVAVPSNRIAEALRAFDTAMEACSDYPDTSGDIDGLVKAVRKARAALAAAPAQAAYSREEWIAQAAQVFVDDGDDQKAAQDLARWHWNQQDWTSGEIDDPREVAREDLAGREKPTAPAQAVAVTEVMVKSLLDAQDEYWREADAEPRAKPCNWRNGMDYEAARIGLEAALFAPAQEHATQLAGQGQDAPTWGDIYHCMDDIRALLARQHKMHHSEFITELAGIVTATPRREDDYAAASDQAQGCTRSHPHENMSPMCVLRTEIARLNHAEAVAQARDPFQQRVQPWLLACFGAEIAGDKQERNHRFLEEAVELVQANGCTASEAHQLVDYVFGRPVGEPAQEVGGVMVTLAALCLASGLDMHQAGEVELARIWGKVEQIRAKQAAKPKHSPLPAAPVQAQEDALDAVLTGRTDAEIVAQTEELAKYLLHWKWGLAPESTDAHLRNSQNTKAQVAWNAACDIQELLTATDVENAVAEVDDAARAAQGGA